ncbi:hypothetical protein [Streptomyces sp. CA-179760]|uniref:hypothetical protein n=1 Tax=Streptomyces sp. CA-179760 TaxID=3240054 RepID=UPI003D8EC85E
MRITVLGAESMACGIATRAQAGGHTVTLAGELSAQATGDAAVHVGDDSAVDTAELVELAVPFIAAGFQEPS